MSRWRETSATPPLDDRIPVLADLSGTQHGLYFAAATRFVRALHERVAPLTRVMVQATAVDPGLEELRPGLTKARAAAVMVTVHSPYVYSILTDDLGWSAEAYEKWLAHALPRLLMRAELLAE
jgi:hypothetical protein